jgi:hypothetical protein
MQFVIREVDIRKNTWCCSQRLFDVQFSLFFLRFSALITFPLFLQNMKIHNASLESVKGNLLILEHWFIFRIVTYEFDDKSESGNYNQHHGDEAPSHDRVHDTGSFLRVLLNLFPLVLVINLTLVWTYLFIWKTSKYFLVGIHELVAFVEVFF